MSNTYTTNIELKKKVLNTNDIKTYKLYIGMRKFGMRLWLKPIDIIKLSLMPTYDNKFGSNIWNLNHKLKIYYTRF